MSYKKWILTAIFLFGIGMALGLVAPSGITAIIDEDITALKELSGILAPFSVYTAIFIFIKNTSVLLLSFMLSPIFCLTPILALITNGLFLTFISAIVIQEKSLGYVLSGLLPHGIIELPAFILGQAAALSFGTTLILAIFIRRRRDLLLPSLKRSLIYLLIALTLLLPAAIIETYVTPLLLT